MEEKKLVQWSKSQVCTPSLFLFAHTRCMTPDAVFCQPRSSSVHAHSCLHFWNELLAGDTGAFAKDCHLQLVVSPPRACCPMFSRTANWS